MNSLVYNEHTISQKGEMLCLTDMWKAAGAPENGRPANWARKDGSQFIEFIAENLNVSQGHIEKLIKTVRGGRRPGTWAHWQIGLAYAKYLSPEFHAWCNQVVRDHMMGTVRRLSVREEGKKTRNSFTSVLRSHGCSKPDDFRRPTNSIYLGLWDLDAAGLRKKHNLPEKANVRNSMGEIALGSVLLSEALASERISQQNIWGVEKCSDASNGCAKLVRGAVVAARSNKLIGAPGD